MGLAEAAAAIAAGRLSSSALVAACLGVIERREPFIGAWQHLDAERAQATARERDLQAGRGPLHGVPIGIKDVIDTVDMPTAYGSKLYEGFRPVADATAVALLRRAGAVVVGKTVTTEFASVAPARTRNPVNPLHTPGGSSSGSAAAVAAGMVPAALGTQTAGSVIRPAAYCGVVGYKPSFGLIDATGVKALARSFDTVGVFARSVRDAALLASVLADRPHLAAVPDGSRARIGLFLPPWCATAEPVAIEVVRHAAAALTANGHDVVEIESIPGFDALLEAQRAVMDWDQVHALLFEFETGGDRIDPVTRAALLERSARMSAEESDAARQTLGRIRTSLHQQLAQVDSLLVPSAPGEAPFGLGSTGSSDFSRGWTALHSPCIAVPAGYGPRRLPLGVQIVGRPGGDAAALAGAAAVERGLEAAPYSAGKGV